MLSPYLPLTKWVRRRLTVKVTLHQCNNIITHTDNLHDVGQVSYSPSLKAQALSVPQTQRRVELHS